MSFSNSIILIDLDLWGIEFYFSAPNRRQMVICVILEALPMNWSLISIHSHPKKVGCRVRVSVWNPYPNPRHPSFPILHPNPTPDTREFSGFAPDTRTDTRYIFAKNTVLSAVIDKKLYFTNIYLNILNSKRYYRKYLEKILIINLRKFF